jgi:AcrR family transcriptional regulator
MQIMQSHGKVATMSTLREENRRIARARILQALADEIVENGIAALAIPAVAKRAGVSLRTVYNYFESKETLVEALPPWAAERIQEYGARLFEADLERMTEAIPVNFRAFSAMGTVMQAISRIGVALQQEGSEIETSVQIGTRRSAELRDAIAAERPDLAERQVLALAGVVHTLRSFDTWNRLAHGFGLDGDEAGEVASWAFATLVQAIRAGEGPYDREG